MNTKTLTQLPPKDLFAKVKGGFVSQHTTLNRWCQEHGHKRQNARKALLGEWSGPAGVALREQLIKASGVGS